MESTVLKKELEPTFEALGRVIRERRVSLGMSQEELADKSGLHRTYVSDVERGIRNLTLGALWFICNGLNISLSQIVNQMENRAEADALNPAPYKPPRSTAKHPPALH